jgi:hypothetical protein
MNATILYNFYIFAAREKMDEEKKNNFLSLIVSYFPFSSRLYCEEELVAPLKMKVLETKKERWVL